MIRSALEVIFPIPSLPESEPFHISIIVAHGSVAIRCPVKVKIYKFFQVCSDNLIGIHEYDFLEIHGEQNVKKEDLVSPNDTLLLFLST
jgi:hypothetical protein